MPYYDITVRVSADAVRAAQTELDKPALEAHETITTEHLKNLGEFMAVEIHDAVDAYDDATAHVSYVAGPFSSTGGDVVGASGPLAEVSRLHQTIYDLNRHRVGLELELERTLDSLLEQAPKCWSSIPRPLPIVVTEYLRALERTVRTSDTSMTSVHDDFCDGTCS